MITNLQDQLQNCESKLVQESNALARVHQNFLNAAVGFNATAELDEARSRIRSAMRGLQWLLDVPLETAETVAAQEARKVTA